MRKEGVRGVGDGILGLRCIAVAGLRHSIQRQTGGLCCLQRRTRIGDNTSLGNAAIHVAQAMYGAFIVWQRG
jgi:hypothetical protein